MKATRSVLTFDGTEGCYVKVERKAAHKVARELTVEAWVLVNEQGPEWTGIVSKAWHTAATQSGYGLLLDGDGGILLGMKPAGSAMRYRTSGSDALPLNEWHHVAGTYDGKAMTLYIDGEKQESYAEDIPSIGYDPENDLYIGTNKDDDEARPFDGKIAEVRVWDRARTQEELKRDMYARLRGDEPNLVVYFPIDEGEGTTTGSLGPDRCPGSIVGARWEKVEVPFPGKPEPAGPEKGKGGGGGGEGPIVPPNTGGKLPGAIDTSAVLAAALERLNRQSVIGVLQQIVQEVDEHCRMMGAQVGEEITKLRKELMILIDGLRQTTDKHERSITDIQKQLVELQKIVAKINADFEINVTNIIDGKLDLKLPDILQKINIQLESTIRKIVGESFQQIDLSDVFAKITELNAKLTLIKKAAEELDEGELKQVEALLRTLLKTIDFGDILQQVNLTINGTSFGLMELLRLLATADRVRSIDFTYDRRDITGATYTLLDGTAVQFVAKRIEDAVTSRLTYRFEALSWKGVPASFELAFKKSTETWSMCKRPVTLDTYDAVHQSNIVFDVRPR